MKKLLAICLMVVMVVSMSVTAFAAPGGFISSPSGNPAPTVEAFEPSNDDCDGHLTVTPYGDRSDLSNDIRITFEGAYDDIVNSDDLTKINADLAKVAADKGIAGTDLAVSDLFDISVVGCHDHKGHYDFNITLAADTLYNFVGLLHKPQGGDWELVSDAEVVNNGTNLKFSVKTLSPFAIVVKTSDAGTLDVPETGDDSMVHVYAIIMAISALAIIVIAVLTKKRKA